MSIDDQIPAPARIEIPGDVLVPDPDFRREVLDDCSARTSKRLEREGLPFVFVRGRKWRPLNAGRAWLASRIQSRVPQKRRRAP